MKKTLAALLASAGLASLGCGNTDSFHTNIKLSVPPIQKNISFTNKEGILYTAPVNCYADRVMVLDNGEKRLHFYESAFFVNNTVDLGEYVVLTGPQEFTHLLRYDSIDTTNRQLTFTDLGTSTRQVTYDSQTKIAELVAAGIVYQMHVDPASGKLAIDQTGDGLYKADQAPIVDINGNVTLEEDLTQ